MTAAKTQNQPLRLVVSLDNSDSDRVFLQLLQHNILDVLTGIQATAFAIGACESILFIPAEAEPLASQIAPATEALGIRLVKDDFCDRFQYPGAIFHHLATMVVLATVVSGDYQAGTFVAVRANGATSPLTWVEFGTKVATLPGLVTEDYKLLTIGSAVFGKNGLDQVIDQDLSLGNGIITLYGSGTCVVNEAENQLSASLELSCGKCTFCREGLLQLHGFVRDMTKGKGKADFVPLLHEIGDAIPAGSLCSVGQTGASFLMGTLSVFPQEYEDHIRKRKCPAGVCTAFIPIYIDPEACTGCGDCVDVCPVDCIEGKSGYIHMIDDLECTKCGKCIEVCEDQAIIRGSGRLPALPDRLTRVGKFRKR